MFIWSGYLTGSCIQSAIKGDSTQVDMAVMMVFSDWRSLWVFYAVEESALKECTLTTHISVFNR